jgi:hypothetical protein
MPSKDYILRMIEQMAQIVRHIRQLIMGGNIAEAEREMEASAARTGLDLAVGRAMDGQSLLNLFIPPGSTVDPTNCMLFGEILYLDALRDRQLGNLGEAHIGFAKALLLLEAATDERRAAGLRYPEIDERIDELRELLEE